MSLVTSGLSLPSTSLSSTEADRPPWHASLPTWRFAFLQSQNIVSLFGAPAVLPSILAQPGAFLEALGAALLSSPLGKL